MTWHESSRYWLAALALLPLIWWAWRRSGRRTALRFSAVDALLRQRRGLGVWGRNILPLLRTLAVGLLVLALARPEKGDEQTRIYAEGIAIQMVVDRSGTMETTDYVCYEPQWRLAQIGATGAALRQLAAERFPLEMWREARSAHVELSHPDFIQVVQRQAGESWVALDQRGGALYGLQAKDEQLSMYRACTRLEAVKKVFTDFVRGKGDSLKGRPDDLIGLIAFATYPESLTPMTLDHENVLAVLDELQTAGGPEVKGRLEDLDRQYRQALRRGDRRMSAQYKAEAERIQREAMTAIGDGLALAVERLRGLDRKSDERADSDRIKGKVIILLTDGENNAGELAPEQAAMLAKASEIRVYSIGIGSLLRGGELVDANQMQQVAEITGGRFFTADDVDGLEKVYSEIDKLEKTQTEQRRFLRHTQAATSWITWAGLRWPPILLVVIALLALEVLLSNTRFRRLP